MSRPESSWGGRRNWARGGGRRQTRRDATRKRSSKCSLASRGVSRFSVWGDNVLVGRPVPFSRLSFATVLVRAVWNPAQLLFFLTFSGTIFFACLPAGFVFILIWIYLQWFYCFSSSSRVELFHCGNNIKISIKSQCNIVACEWWCVVPNGNKKANEVIKSDISSESDHPEC